MPAAGEMRLERMIDILTALGEPESTTNGGLGVVRVAEIVGREKSQVSRALRTLNHAGLVERDTATREYRLGWRLFALAARVGDQTLLAVGPPVLHRLVAAMGETAHLTVLDGGEVVTVLSESSPSSVRAIEWVGHGVPAHSTSSGRALLLDHDADSLRALLGDGRLDAPHPHAPRTVAALAKRIAAARADGYVIVDEEFEPGLVGVAAPVRNFRGRIVAALNVSAPKFRLGDRLAAAGGEIRQAADGLSSRLGWKADARANTNTTGEALHG
jgi:IclR family transcriptional regulator, KDG regulon repressor